MRVTFLKNRYKLEIFKNLKLNKMKKLLLVFTVAAFLTACNGNSTTENTSDTSSVSTSVDTTNTMSTDTTNTMGADTTNTMSADTTNH